MCVQAPRNAIELDISPLDLALAVDGEQVEAFNLILPRTDVREEPVPHDLVAAMEDVESDDARVWMRKNFGEPLVSRGSGRSIAELENRWLVNDADIWETI